MRSSWLITPLLSLLAACGAADSPSDEGADAVTSGVTTAAEAAGWRAQVIYLVMPDRFRNGDPSNDDAGAAGCHAPGDPHRFHGGDLEGLRKNLGYLRELGATAIWVTPLYRQVPRLGNGQCGYHGYWADYTVPYDGAIEPKLGSDADLRRLVGDVHAGGQRLVLDMVVNHAGDIAAARRQRPDWFHDARTCGGLGNPTIFCPLDGHPDFIQERADVAAYLSDAAAGWIRTYGIDGVRMDTARHVLPSYFRTSFLPAVRAPNASLFTVAEIFDEGSTSALAPYLDAGFDSAFHFELRRAFVDAIGKGGSVDAIANAIADGVARLGMNRALDLVLMLDNHDVQRFANEPGWGVPEDDIRARLLLGFDLLFTLPGIPQLYYGDELGLYGGPDPDNRRDFPAWATDANARADRHAGEAVSGSAQIFARVAKLARLRTSAKSLADGAYKELWRQNGARNPNVLAFSRGAGDGARIVVVNDGAKRTGAMRIPVPAGIVPTNATLVDELGDGAPNTLALDRGAVAIDLPARSAAIYRVDAQ